MLPRHVRQDQWERVCRRVCNACGYPFEQAAQVMLPRHVRQDQRESSAGPDGSLRARGFSASRAFVKALAVVCMGVCGCVSGFVCVCACVCTHMYFLNVYLCLFVS